MSWRKKKLALELEGSDLYNRRKTGTSQFEEENKREKNTTTSNVHQPQTTGHASSSWQPVIRSPFLKEILGSTSPINESHNHATSMEKSNIYANSHFNNNLDGRDGQSTPLGTRKKRHVPVNPLPKPPRLHGFPLSLSSPPSDITNDSETNRLTMIPTPDLKAEFRKQFVDALDLEEAEKEKPPDFAPPLPERLV